MCDRNIVIKLLFLGLIAVLLLLLPAIIADAANDIASSYQVNNTAVVLTPIWTEYANISGFATGAGNTTVTITVNTATNYSTARSYGRLLRDGIVIESFNLSQSVYPETVTYIAPMAETEGIHSYSFESYGTAGKKSSLYNRTFSATFIKTGSFAAGITNTTAQITRAQVTGQEGVDTGQNTSINSKSVFMNISVWGQSVLTSFARLVAGIGIILTQSGTNITISDGGTNGTLTTHTAATASVHGFDASGNAPAQVHDDTKHSGSAKRGVAGGVAALDASGTVPDAEIPTTITKDTELTAHAGADVSASVHPNAVIGTGRYTIYDDFRDNEYAGRYLELDKNMLFIGPEWTVVAGTWDASQGHLRTNTSGNEIQTPNTQAYGSWEFDLKADALDAAPNNIVLSNYIIDIDANNWYRVYINTTSAVDGLHIQKYVNGVPTVIFSASWANDTAWHTYKVTRSTANLFEVFEDDVAKGTVTDSSLTVSNFYVVGYERVGGGIGSYFNLDNIKVHP